MKLYSRGSTSVKLKISKTTSSAKKARGFVIYRNGKAAGSVKSSKNSVTYKVKGLKSGTKYRFTVRPYRIINGKRCLGKTSSNLYVTTTIPAKSRNVWDYLKFKTYPIDHLQKHTEDKYYLKTPYASSGLTPNGSDGKGGHITAQVSYMRSQRPVEVSGRL